MSSLETFSLDGNKYVTGSIPSGINELMNLRVLDLDDNDLTGSIPPALCKSLHSSLQVLDLNDNNFTGAIPAELNMMKSLEFVQLQNNYLTGFIPQLPSLSNLSKCYYCFVDEYSCTLKIL